jgi:hypothetical protein
VNDFLKLRAAMTSDARSCYIVLLYLLRLANARQYEVAILMLLSLSKDFPPKNTKTLLLVVNVT